MYLSLMSEDLPLLFFFFLEDPGTRSGSEKCSNGCLFWAALECSKSSNSNSSRGLHFILFSRHAHIMQITCSTKMASARILLIFSCFSKNLKNLECSADFFWSSGM